MVEEEYGRRSSEEKIEKRKEKREERREKSYERVRIGKVGAQDFEPNVIPNTKS